MKLKRNMSHSKGNSKTLNNERNYLYFASEASYYEISEFYTKA